VAEHRSNLLAKRGALIRRLIVARHPATTEAATEYSSDSKIGRAFGTPE
jgi:hypothetical protein